MCLQSVGANLILFQSQFSHRKKRKLRVFPFLAIFEFHLVYRLKKGQRSDQNLNYFTFYDRAINFTYDGENFIAVYYSQQLFNHLKKCSRTGT